MSSANALLLLKTESKTCHQTPRLWFRLCLAWFSLLHFRNLCTYVCMSSPNIDRFLKFFTATLCGKFAITCLLNIHNTLAAGHVNNSLLMFLLSSPSKVKPAQLQIGRRLHALSTLKLNVACLYEDVVGGSTSRIDQSVNESLNQWVIIYAHYQIITAWIGLR